ncbi:MAG: metallophosphoesterase family protein, partial [Alphaproteobacteria bacterium]
MPRFIHLTDLHLSVPDMDDPLLHADTAAALDLAVNKIKALEPKVDFVAISGDLANHGKKASYAHLKTALAPLQVPIVMSLGNHDDRSNFRSVFGGSGAPDTPLFAHMVIDGLHIIALDSSVPGRVGGAIGDAQFEALETALRAHQHLPKLILCHHPPRPELGETLVWESL